MKTRPPLEHLGDAVLAWTQELAPHGIFITDDQLKIQSWNSWLETHTGLKAADVVGKTLAGVFPKLEPDRLSSHYESALKGQVALLSTSLHGYLLPFASTVPTAPYEFMQQTARIGPLLRGKEVCGTITTIEDVTNREWQAALLKQQNERNAMLSLALEKLLKTQFPKEVLREILPNIAAGLKTDFIASFLTDDRGEKLLPHVVFGADLTNPHIIEVINAIASLNPVREADVKALVEKYFRQGSAWAVSTGFQGFIWQPLKASDRFFGFILAGTRDRAEFEAPEAEFLSNLGQYVSVAMDRTQALKELFKAQRTLTEHAANLEKKIDERTASLVDTISDLEGFSYTVAHDLRAPIRHIQGYIEELEQGQSERLDDQMDILKRMKAASLRMDTLTKDLLHYSRVARKDIRVEAVDLDALVNEILQHNTALKEPGVVIVHHPLETVLAEPTMLQQCVVNLLENARKFIRRGASPKIQIWKEKARVQSAIDAAGPGLVFNSPQNLPPAGEGDKQFSGPLTVTVPESRPVSGTRPYARIWISDNGIGIAPEYQQKIFGVFERVCDPLEYEGTGIGLAIVAKAMHRMGGRYGVESAPDRGSRFWLELPEA